MDYDKSARKGRSRLRAPDDDLLVTDVGTKRDGSEENILEPQELQNGVPHSITRTDQVIIEYDSHDKDVDGRMPW